MTRPTSHTTGGASSRSDWLAGKPLVLLLLLAVLFLTAAVVRLYKIDAPGISIAREFTSAIFARDFYYQDADHIETWRRDVASALRQYQPTLEPPVTDWIAAKVYGWLGYEDLRAARLLMTAFWLVGGLFLFALIRTLVSVEAAALGLAYYLFQPMAFMLSRSFQPDALMMMGFLAGLYGIVRYHRDQSRRWLVFASIAASLTLLFRPLVLPAMVGAFLVPQIARCGFWKALFSPAAIMFGFIGVLPAVTYYGHAAFVAGHFHWKLGSSFMPHLWLHREYWQGWWELARLGAGLPFLVLSVAGYLWMPRGLARQILVGLAIGYVVFGLLFSMHIHSHDYYQAQLIGIVAFAASPVLAQLARAALGSRALWPKVVAIAMAGWISVSWARSIETGLGNRTFEPVDVAIEVGSLVDHSTRVVFIGRHYGLPLSYFGEFAGTFWPRPAPYWLYRKGSQQAATISERLESLGFQPEYFVITHFREFERNHQDLARYLDAKCSLKARTELYLVYERCLPPGEGE